jgi:hypothetical protein
MEIKIKAERAAEVKEDDKIIELNETTDLKEINAMPVEAKGRALVENLTQDEKQELLAYR